MLNLETTPLKNIIGSKGNELKGKKIILCITGSVAAVRSIDIARELMRHGAEVYTAMTPMAQKIIHPHLMEWATGNPVITELTGKVEHVLLAGEHPWKADLILIAPSTANTISKIACGIDDTPVTTIVSTAMGSKIPIIIVPAMHESMYKHPIIIENIEKLKSLGIEFIGPRIEEGKAKIANIDEIVNAVIRRFKRTSDLAGKRVLVTAGPTIEYIDPIRIITNKSSGKMGIAIAEEALNRGAKVTLIHGKIKITPPQEAKLIKVETTEEMYHAVLRELETEEYHIIISAAAPTDYKPQQPHKNKISSRTKPEIEIKLKQTPKIIDKIKEIKPEIFLVAFKAEHNVPNNELIEKAYQELKLINADLIIANDVAREGVGFEVDTNEAFIIDKEKNILHIPLTTKRELAKIIIDEIIKKTKGSTHENPQTI